MRVREDGIVTEVIRMRFCSSDRPKGQLGQIVMLDLMDEVGLRTPLRGRVSYFEEYPHGYSMAVDVIYHGEECRAKMYVADAHRETDVVELCRKTVVEQARGPVGLKELAATPFETFRERFKPLAESDAFSAYASGERDQSCMIELYAELKHQDVPQELWESDQSLNELVRLITSRMITRK